MWNTIPRSKSIMDNRSTSWTLPITFVAVLLTHTLKVSLAACPGSLSSDGACIFAPTAQTVASWDGAYDACAAQEASLVVVTSSERDRLVRDVMERSQIRKAWIGVREEDTPWYWVKEAQLLQSQGCYKHEAGSPFFSYSVNMAALTREKCLTECAARNYLYAGLKGGNVCHCGNSYRQDGSTTGCNLPCSGNPDQKCGGENAILVLYIAGADGRWGYDQPNNLHGNQRCAAADIFFGGKLNDVICGSANNYICQLDIHLTSCSGTGYQMNAGRCYFISEAMLNWFEARQDCRKRGGDLANLDSGTSDLVESVLDSRVNVNLMWVGLRKGAMEWANGESLAYTHWAPRSPNATAPSCATYVTDNVNAWVDELCDRPLPFLCQTDHPVIPTTTTTTKATTTTRKTTTTTTTTTTRPTITSNRPSSTSIPTTTKSTQKAQTPFTNPPTSLSTSAVTTSHITPSTPPEGTSSSSQRGPISSPDTSVTGSTPEQTGNEEPSLGASSSGGLMSNGQIVIVVLAALLILILVAVGVIVALMVKERKANRKVACFSPRTQSVPSMDSASNFNAHYDTIDKDTGRIIIP